MSDGIGPPLQKSLARAIEWLEDPGELPPDLDNRDWQAELPFLEWTAAGEAAFMDYEHCGKLGLRAKDGSFVAMDDPRLGDYQRFRKHQILWFTYREIVKPANTLDKLISDPEVGEPIPRSIRRENPDFLAWLLNEKSDYTPTWDEAHVLKPAYAERLRRLKERAIGNSQPQTVRTPVGPNGSHLPAIAVDTKLLQVRYEGKVYNVTDAQATGLKALVDADGDWVSWSGLGISKPSRAKLKLPLPLQSLIETSRAKGYRFKRQNK